MLREEQIGFLRELQPQIMASVLLLAMGVIVGAVSGAQFSDMGAHLRESLGSFARMFADLPKPLLASAIFLNNSVKTFLVLILGVLGGILPVFFLLLNGYAIGLVLYLSIQSHGVVSSLMAILPHGIFELPAVLLGASIGIFLGAQAIKRLSGKFQTSLTRDFGRGLRLFWSIILPLLLLAAFIEAFITSVIVAA